MKIKTVLLKNRELTYKVNRSLRATRIRISVSLSHGVTLTVPPFIPLFLGERFLFSKAGWIFNKLDHYKKTKQQNPSQDQDPLKIKGNYRYDKEKARKYIKELIAKVNQHYGFQFNRVAIKNSRTRWGSCSKKKNLNFNYKLLYLKPEQAEYIVAHELCHIKELNHSKKFWTLVAQTFPNYKKIRKELRNIS